MEEIWKDIDGYEGIYQVSNMGNVKSLSRISFQNHRLKERMRSQETDKNGYKIVNLCKDGKVKLHKVHRLVGKAFLDNPYDKEQINHKDGCKCNNCVTNLEWVSASENIQHAFDTGLKISVPKSYYGETNPHCKLSDEQCEEIRMLKQKYNISNAELSKKFGIGTTQISRMIKNIQRSKGSVVHGN